MIEEELLKLRKNATDAKNGDSFDKGVLTTRKTSKEKPLHHGSHYIHKLVAKKKVVIDGGDLIVVVNCISGVFLREKERVYVIINIKKKTKKLRECT